MVVVAEAGIRILKRLQSCHDFGVKGFGSNK